MSIIRIYRKCPLCEQNISLGGVVAFAFLVGFVVAGLLVFLCYLIW